MAKRKPDSKPIETRGRTDSGPEMSSEQLDLRSKALEIEKLEAEIGQIKKGNSNIWRTPTALIAILTLAGTCFAFIYREVSTYTTAYKTIAENEKLRMFWFSVKWSRRRSLLFHGVEFETESTRCSWGTSPPDPLGFFA